MTLLERTQSLEARGKLQREQDVREKLAEKLRARTSNLESNLKQLDAARSRVDALEKAGHSRSPWPAPPVDVFAAYDQKESAPLSLESPRQGEWEKFIRALSKFVEKAEKAVGHDVKQARDRAFEGVSEEDLRSYLDDPSTENQAQQLLRTLETLRGKNWEGMPGAELLLIFQRANSFREEVVSLRETGASEELLRFLGMARKDGATLDGLTDPLRAELDARKLLGRLRILLK